MEKIKSIFELENGSIIKLDEIRYINKQFKFIDIAGGQKILFDTGEELEKLIDNYKKFIAIFDKHTSLKMDAERSLYSIENVYQKINKISGKEK